MDDDQFEWTGGVGESDKSTRHLAQRQAWGGLAPRPTLKPGEAILGVVILGTLPRAGLSDPRRTTVRLKPQDVIEAAEMPRRGV